MGKDGARGTLEMQQAGAYTVAQNEARCVVYGLPKEAVAMGGVREIVALKEIAQMILNHLSHKSGST